MTTADFAADFNKDWSNPAWPPGTVRLELLKTGGDAEIILLPRPTFDPNDPLNWPQWRKYLNFGLACFYALMVFAQFDASSPTWGKSDFLHENVSGGHRALYQGLIFEVGAIVCYSLYKHKH
jgi:hypothetical protein